MLFSILLLWILLYTHWLPNLEKELNCSRLMINLFLLAMVISYWIPPLSFRSRVVVHIGLILMLILFYYFFLRVREKVRFVIVLISSSTIAFTLHWLFYFPVDWHVHSFRLLMIFLFVFGSYALNSLIERVAYLWGGCVLMHIMLLVANREMFNPVVIGEQPFLDFCWLAMFVLLLMHHGISPLFIQLRKR